jgi:hypothetical protein
MDTTQQTAEIRQDLESLEHTAERSAQRFARRVAPYVIATVVLSAWAWRVGRKRRNRRAG